MPELGYMIDSTIIEIRQGKPVSVKTGSQEALVVQLLRIKESGAATVLVNIEKDTNGFVPLSIHTATDGNDPFPNDGWYANVTNLPK